MVQVECECVLTNIVFSNTHFFIYIKKKTSFLLALTISVGHFNNVGLNTCDLMNDR